MRTFINWSGNKTKHIKKFEKYLPKEIRDRDSWKGTYIEPFVGSGALLLNLEPERWIINDLNKDLINVWKLLKKDVGFIIEESKKFGKIFKKLSKEKQVSLCRETTNELNNHISRDTRSILFLLMTSCAYMGIIIKNNKFYFQGLKINMKTQNLIYFLSEKYYDNLKRISYFLNESNGQHLIYNKDYKLILKTAKKNDFVFLDPPYMEEHKYGFNYNKKEQLDESFLDELYIQVDKLNKKGVKWLMTQADTKIIKKIFKEFTIKKIKVYRFGKKSYTTELLIMNY